MEYKNKIIPTKVLLSLDGSESFIIRTLKDRIMSNPIQFGCATYGDLEGKKYKIYYDNNVNKNDILRSIEFVYYRDDESPELFELCNLNTDRIEITEPVDISYSLNLFGNKGIAQIDKKVEFFIKVNNKYKVKIIAVIRIHQYELKEDVSILFNKITSVTLVDRYAFSNHGFKIHNEYISTKINYTPGYNITEGCNLLIELLENTLEGYLAPLRKIAAK